MGGSRMLRYCANFPKRQPKLGLKRNVFWKEFRKSQQQRAASLKAAVTKFRGRNRKV
jgi:hypothetical protein